MTINDAVASMPIATVKHGLAVHVALTRQQREALAAYVVTPLGKNTIVCTADTPQQVADLLERYAVTA